MSHGQLGTESPIAESEQDSAEWTDTKNYVTETEQDSEHGTGLEHAQGLGGNMSNCNESNENNQESQDLNQDQGKKSNEWWDSEKKSQEQCDWDD